MAEKKIMRHTLDELKTMQALPLDIKVRMTQARIRQWVNEFGVDGTYVSFSGGKDSTILLHLVREIYPELEAVFVNTGLEYPEIQKFVRGFDNVTILTPKMRFSEVITKYGYPFISKRTAHVVEVVRKNGITSNYYKFFDKSYDSLFNVSKYEPLLKVDFNISSKCCDIMKKDPIHKYTERYPMTGQQASESLSRSQTWQQFGCNAFEAKHPISNPMAFWTEQDVLKYIRENKVEIASVYGEIVVDGDDGYGYSESLLPNCKYRTTGCERTGCIFCGFGAHLEKGEGRFQRLKHTHPKHYDYCLGGGAYDGDGLWKPSKDGLGMAHCIDEFNRLYGKDFIRY